MVRVCILAAVALCLSAGSARSDENEDSLKKDLMNLKGAWFMFKEKDTDKDTWRVLLLGEGDPLLVLGFGPGGKFGEQEKGDLTLLASVLEKDKKRYLKFIGVLERDTHLLEYELSRDKLKLSGMVGGINVSGEWIRQKDTKYVGRRASTSTSTTHYVSYWCLEWRNSEKFLPAGAKEHADRLKQLGVETRLITVGVTPAPGTRFPDPKQVSGVQKVQFRLTELKSIPLKDETEVLLAAGWLQSSGLDVKVTTGKPLKEIPKEVDVIVRLPEESVWRGTIIQLDRELPAELKLSNSGGTLKGELTFTFQPLDFQNRPLPKKTFCAEIEGEVKGGTVVLTATKALEGNVFIPTTYTLKFTSTRAMKGQWECESQRLAGEISFVAKKP